jgi:hypothetical protein
MGVGEGDHARSGQEGECEFHVDGLKAAPNVLFGKRRAPVLVKERLRRNEWTAHRASMKKKGLTETLLQDFRGACYLLICD